MTSTVDSPALWLDDPRACDVARIGGKAASLCRLAVRHRVPHGFCLTARTLADLLGSRRGAQSGVAALHAIVVEWYTRLGERTGCISPSVAVRSSGVDEDGEGSSFAGQYETILNVQGVEAVCDAVAACWESGQGERVLAYRATMGLGGRAGTAVLVQELVSADSAAVAFSVDPVVGDHGVVVINANYGLGESVVSGTVTPDTYVVRKDDLATIATTIGSKTVMTVRTPTGTEVVSVPRFLRGQQVLSQGQVAEIARLAIDLEAVMGRPVDIECAISGDVLYLLQCRPITTLGR